MVTYQEILGYDLADSTDRAVLSDRFEEGDQKWEMSLLRLPIWVPLKHRLVRTTPDSEWGSVDAVHWYEVSPEQMAALRLGTREDGLREGVSSYELYFAPLDHSWYSGVLTSHTFGYDSHIYTFAYITPARSLDEARVELRCRLENATHYPELLSFGAEVAKLLTQPRRSERGPT
jgi:hypothetical protein